MKINVNALQAEHKIHERTRGIQAEDKNQSEQYSVKARRRIKVLKDHRDLVQNFHKDPDENSGAQKQMNSREITRIITTFLDWVREQLFQICFYPVVVVHTGYKRGYPGHN